MFFVFDYRLNLQGSTQRESDCCSLRERIHSIIEEKFKGMGSSASKNVISLFLMHNSAKIVLVVEYECSFLLCC